MKNKSIWINSNQHSNVFSLVVKLNLISSSNTHLMKCKQDIIDLAQSFSVESEFKDKDDVLHWSQQTIYKFYEFCLKQDVLPTLDLDNVTLKLVGAKDAVRYNLIRPIMLIH